MPCTNETKQSHHAATPGVQWDISHRLHRRSAVPTAITGYFGQNIPYPGFGKQSGLWFSSVSIVLLAGLLYGVFRYKDWL